MGPLRAREGAGMESKYLTPTQAAEYCNVNYTTIWRAMKAGTLKKAGPTKRAVRYHKDELDRWMQSGGKASGEEQ